VSNPRWRGAAKVSMGRPCTICKKFQPEQRRLIDFQIRNHKPLAEIARENRCSWDMVSRYRGHMRDASAIAAKLANGVGSFEELFFELEQLTDLAKNDGDRPDIKALVQLVTQKTKVLELQAKQPSNGEGGEWVRLGSIEFYDAVIRLAESYEKGEAPPWYQPGVTEDAN